MEDSNIDDCLRFLPTSTSIVKRIVSDCSYILVYQALILNCKNKFLSNLKSTLTQ